MQFEHAISTRRSVILPPHEPHGRARLSPARRAADAKWKRRARDRRALPLLGSGVPCAKSPFGEISPCAVGEGRGEGKWLATLKRSAMVACPSVGRYFCPA